MAQIIQICATGPQVSPTVFAPDEDGNLWLGSLRGALQDSREWHWCKMPLPEGMRPEEGWGEHHPAIIPDEIPF